MTDDTTNRPWLKVRSYSVRRATVFASHVMGIECARVVVEGRGTPVGKWKRKDEFYFVRDSRFPDMALQSEAELLALVRTTLKKSTEQPGPF